MLTYSNILLKQVWSITVEQDLSRLLSILLFNLFLKFRLCSYILYFTTFSIIHLIIISSSSIGLIIISAIINIVVLVVVSILEGHKYISFAFLVLPFLNKVFVYLP